MSDCAAPIPLAALADYWLAEPGRNRPAEGEHVQADGLEEHLMACAACSARLERLATIATGVRRLIGGGRLPLVLTSALLARLEAEGMRIRHHRPDAGGRVACTAGPQDDLVTVRLSGDFRPGERIDVVMAGAPGLSGRLEDVPVDHERGEIILVEPAAAIRPLPAHRATIRALAVAETGERTIAEYVLDHRPWAGSQ